MKTEQCPVCKIRRKSNATRSLCSLLFIYTPTRCKVTSSFRLSALVSTPHCLPSSRSICGYDLNQLEAPSQLLAERMRTTSDKPNTFFDPQDPGRLTILRQGDPRRYPRLGKSDDSIKVSPLFICRSSVFTTRSTTRHWTKLTRDGRPEPSQRSVNSTEPVTRMTLYINFVNPKFDTAMEFHLVRQGHTYGQASPINDTLLLAANLLREQAD